MSADARGTKTACFELGFDAKVPISWSIVTRTDPKTVEFVEFVWYWMSRWAARDFQESESRMRRTINIGRILTFSEVYEQEGFNFDRPSDISLA
jgi:hypothetical protein